MQKRQASRGAFKPPVKPTYMRYPGGWRPNKPDLRNALVPFGLLGFVTTLSVILILVVVVRGPDTHSSLWNEVKDGYSRTGVVHVSAATIPDVTLPPLQSAPSQPGAPPTSTPTAAPPPAVVSFAKDVLPLLKASCSSCHGAAVSFKGVNLTSYQAIADIKAHPPLFVPGKPQESLLINVLKGKPTQMPPTGALTGDKIAIIDKWIEQGAPDN